MFKNGYSLKGLFSLNMESAVLERGLQHFYWISLYGDTFIKSGLHFQLSRQTSF